MDKVKKDPMLDNFIQASVEVLIRENYPPDVAGAFVAGALTCYILLDTQATKEGAKLAKLTKETVLSHFADTLEPEAEANLRKRVEREDPFFFASIEACVKEVEEEEKEPFIQGACAVWDLYSRERRRSLSLIFL